MNGVCYFVTLVNDYEKVSTWSKDDKLEDMYNKDKHYKCHDLIPILLDICIRFIVK